MMRRAGFRLVLAAITLVVAEVVFRAARWSDYDEQVTKRIDGPLLELAPNKPWFIEARKNAAWEQVLQHSGTEVRIVHHTDAAGWRVQPAVQTTPSTKRVLCLGDAYLFGMAVADGETFPCRLQQTLRAHNVDVVTLNRAVPGYNTSQQWERLQQLFDADRPDIVVLGYVVNDAEPVSNFPLPPDVMYRYCRSWLWDACVPFVNEIGRLLVTDQPLSERRILSLKADLNKSFAYASPGWRESRAALQAMHAFLSARNVPLVVFVLPAFTEPFDDSYGYCLLHERVAEWCRELGFAARDLLPLFFGEDHRELWVPGDSHPGPVAHRRMAEAAAIQLLPLLQ